MDALLTVAAPVFGLVFCGFLAARFRLLGERYGVFVARTSATILISTARSVVTVSAVLVLVGVE